MDSNVKQRLESIYYYHPDLTVEDFIYQLKNCGYTDIPRKDVSEWLRKRNELSIELSELLIRVGLMD
jgi:hypothetical protein